jgi:hypothetical protein
MATLILTLTDRQLERVRLAAAARQLSPETWVQLLLERELGPDEPGVDTEPIIDTVLRKNAALYRRLT